MKKIFRNPRVYLVAAILILIGALTSSGLLWQEHRSSQTKIDAYVFPITPKGNPEIWKTLKTKEEMTEACQIPTDVLKRMTTEGLVETCFNYPLLSNFTFALDLQKGFDNLIDSFNGVQALLERPDAGRELLKYYKQMNIAEMFRSSHLSSYRLQFIDMVLVYEKILTKMTAAERHDLLAASMQNAWLILYKLENKHGISTTGPLIARIMMKDSQEFNEMLRNDQGMMRLLDSEATSGSPYSSFITVIPIKEWEIFLDKVEQVMKHEEEAVRKEGMLSESSSYRSGLNENTNDSKDCIFSDLRLKIQENDLRNLFYINYQISIRGTKDDADIFLKLQGQVDDMKKEVCYNITPKEVSIKTACRIFKYSDTTESFLVYAGQIFKLSESFGGFGVMDIRLCDLNRDGKYELLYSYSFGSGLHRSMVGYFDLNTLTATRLDYIYLNEDMMIYKNLDGSFSLYHANVSPSGNNMVDFDLTSGKHLADIVYMDGKIGIKSESSN